MNYTVLGSSGFIGGRLFGALKASGAKVFAPARGDEKVFTSDLGAVFYCIGLTNDYKDRPFDTVEAHVSFLSRILEKASFSRLIYLSSTRLYDGAAGERVREKDDLTLNPANPRHLFDLSKALGENLCLNESVGRASVARLSSVYDASPDATGFFSDLLKKLKQEKNFTLDSDSGAVRDYIHVDDVVKTLIKMSETKGSEIINVASGENISNQDIVDCLKSRGYNITLKRNSSRENRPVCDIEKLKTLGVRPVSAKDFLKEVKLS